MNKRFILGSASIAALLLSSAPTIAQTASASAPTATDSNQIEEVQVTAQRRSQSILKVPLAVTALTPSDLQKQGVTQASDLSSIVPNLQVNSGFGDTQPNFSLRGISVGNEYDGNQLSPVGVYVDDAYITFRTMQGLQLYDLERVEVLSGPQGTLYGRNTTGGAINFITQKPELSGSNGYVDVSYGNFNEVHVLAAYEGTIEEDKLGFRAALDYQKRDGFDKNVYSGQPANNSIDTLNGRFAIRWDPIDSLDINLKFYDGRSNPTQAGVTAIGTGPNGVVPSTGFSRAGLGFYQTNEDKVGHSYSNGYGTELTIKYSLTDKLSFQSLTSYDRARQDLVQDVDGSPFDQLDTDYKAKFEQVNQELRMTYSGDQLDVQSGLYYGSNEDKAYSRYAFFKFLTTVDGLPPDPTLAAGGIAVDQYYNQSGQSEAAFAQADYKLTPSWMVTGGLRITNDSLEYADGNANLDDFDFNHIVNTVPGVSPTGYNDVLPTKKHSNVAFTGHAALTYTFDDGQIAYASFSHGYRSGSYSGQGYLDVNSIQFVQPETVNAYEVGAKGLFFNNTVSLTGSGFYYDYTNQQINEIIGAVGFLRNAGASTIYGFEGQGVYHATDNLNLHASFGYLHTRYDQLTLSGNNLAGNELPFAPDVSANVGADLTIPAVLGGLVTISPSVVYTAHEWFSPFNAVAGNQNLQQGEVYLLNLTAEWKRDNVTLRLWGNNLNGKKYYAYGLDLRSGFGFDYLLPAAPRTFGGAVRYDF